MQTAGLIDRVRRGHYAVRQLGVLGTPAAAEDIALSVGAALKGLPHRIAYRSALHEHDLVVHPARSIQVATDRRVRTRTLSGWPLPHRDRTIRSTRRGTGAVGVVQPLRIAIAPSSTPPSVRALSAGWRSWRKPSPPPSPSLRKDILMEYARRLGWSAALRRLGSLADALALEPLAGGLAPIKPITADLDLEPGTDEPTVWRDGRWRVRWPRTVDELLAVIGQ